MAQQLTIVEGPPGHDQPPPLTIVEGPGGPTPKQAPPDMSGDVVLDNLRGMGRAVRAGARGAIDTVHGIESGLQTLAAPIRKKLGMPPATPPIYAPAETTTAGKLGRGVEQAAELLIPAGLAEEVGKLLQVAPRLRVAGFSRLVAKYGKAAVDTVLQAGGVYGTARAQRDPHPVAAAVFQGGATAATSQAAGATLKASATKTMAKLLGEETTTPAGAREKIAERVAAAFDAGIPATWKRWFRQTETAKAAAGKAVGATVASPVGDSFVPVQPVFDALDQLEVKSGVRGARVPSPGPIPGTVIPMLGTRDEPLLRQIQSFRNKLNRVVAQQSTQGMVPVRALHDLKETWNAWAKYVRNPKTAPELRTLIADARARTARSAVGAIRDVFATDAPTMSKVDRAYHLTTEVHAGVAEAALEATGKFEGQVARGIGAAIKRFAVTGSIGGAAIGGRYGYEREGIPGAVGGALVGAMTGRLLERAFQSPMWKAWPAASKNALAEAIAHGQTDRVRTLVAPLIAGTAARTTLSNPPAGTAGAPGQSPPATPTAR